MHSFNTIEKAVKCINDKNWSELKVLVKEPGILDLNLAENLPHLSYFEMEPTLLYYIQRYVDDSETCKQVLQYVMQHSDWEKTDSWFQNTPFTFAVSTNNIVAIDAMFDYIKENNPELLTQENKEHDDAKNTPLLLAIKNANRETALKLIPYYEEKDLLSLSRQRNSALHLACYLKMNDVIIAIVKQAETLGCMEAVLRQVNGKLFTANELYKTPFLQAQGYQKNGVYLIGREKHFHMMHFGEEIDKHGFNYETDSDKEVIKGIEDLLTSEHLHKKPISVDELINIYQTPETSDENKAWIAISDSKKGAIIPKAQGGSGGDFGNGWKVHISIDPPTIEIAAILIVQILNLPEMPRVSIKFAGKELAQSGQPGKQVALCFYEEELETPEKIAMLLNAIDQLLTYNGIGKDDRAINSIKKYIDTKWDVSILDTSDKPSRFNYRNEDCTVLEDELFKNAALELKQGLPGHYVVVKDNYILQDRGAQVKQSYYLKKRMYGKGHCPIEFSDLTQEEKQNDNAKYFKDPFASMRIELAQNKIATNKSNLDWDALSTSQQSDMSVITKKDRKVSTSEYWATLTLEQRQALLQAKPDYEKKSTSNLISHSMFATKNQMVPVEPSDMLAEAINTQLDTYYKLIDKEVNAIFYTNKEKIAFLTKKCNVLFAARTVLAGDGSNFMLLKQAEALNAGWDKGNVAVSLVNQVKTRKNIPLNWDDSEQPIGALLKI